MPEPDFRIKEGDRLPSLAATLYDAEGVFDDLSLASGVMFKMVSEDGLTTVGPSAAVIVDGLLGRVRYDWGASDTTTAKVYNAEFIITIAGKEQTFPVDGFMKIEVEADL